MNSILNYSVLLIILFVYGSTAYAQQEYIPRNIQDAYDKGTRSLDGAPGPNYWQNSSDYTIKADFNPSNRLLTGKEKIVYHNDSPDTLNRIVLRLYQNINKCSAARNFPLSDELISDGMVIEKIAINGKEQDLSDKGRFGTAGTLFIINVKENPVKPHSDITLNIDWNFTMPPGESIRMGMYDSTSALIGYWYPQVSVYDDLDGWDMIPYTGIQEFYNDFANYDVELTVPNDFGVWGTGVLQNPEEVFSKEYLERYKTALTSDSVINIISKDDLGKAVFNHSKSLITWKYKAENITDVVYGTSDHYLWDGLSLEVEPGRRVYIAAVYKKESQDFYGAADIARQCIDYFSTEMPAVPFPFPSFTVFNGSGGMEFPMLINDGSMESYRSTIGLTSHESAHQYFPFYMGTNEQKYAWMDEGWAVFLPADLELKLLNDRRRIEREAENFSIYAGTENDIPLFVTTDNMSYRPYRMASYTRPGLSYLFLREVLGDVKFKNALQTYMNKWQRKHPMPFDYFFSFNKSADSDLMWFWKSWYFSRDYADLGIKNVVLGGNNISVEVERKGQVPVPVVVSFIYSDGSRDSINKPVPVWEKNNSIKLEFHPVKPVTRIILGELYIPDSNPADNTYEVERNNQ